MSPKYYAATLSAAHGDRLTNEDLRALAEEEFRANPALNAAEWGRRLGVPERTVRRWVAHITQAWRREREIIAWHLHKLGWTQEEIGKKLGIAQQTVSDILTEIGHLADFGKNLPTDWNDRLLQQEAERFPLLLWYVPGPNFLSEGKSLLICPPLSDVGWGMFRRNASG